MTVKNEAYARTCANIVKRFGPRRQILLSLHPKRCLHMKTSTPLEQPEQKMQ